MSEEEKALSGLPFNPNVKELSEKKSRAHRLSREYNKTNDEDIEQRNAILHELVGSIGTGCGALGPIFFHYGCHTTIGNNVYMNMNFVVQDDCYVSIGNDCRFGPNVTIVTPTHPLDANQRRSIISPDGTNTCYCIGKPVKIGNDCWFGANVTVCPGVTIGDRCVIGAGSVVTRDIPDDSLAVGVPCKVLRKIDSNDIIELP